MSHSSEFSMATIHMQLYSCLYRCILFYSPCGNTALIHLGILLRADQAPHSHDIPCCFCCKMLMRSFNVGVYWVLSIMPNILEILVKSQMEKSISVQCKLNIRNHLQRQSTIIGLTCWTEICLSVLRNWFVGHPTSCQQIFVYVGDWGNKIIENGKGHSFQLSRFE